MNQTDNRLEDLRLLMEEQLTLTEMMREAYIALVRELSGEPPKLRSVVQCEQPPQPEGHAAQKDERAVFGPMWSEEEDEMLVRCMRSLLDIKMPQTERYEAIAEGMPSRSASAIGNRWRMLCRTPKLWPKGQPTLDRPGVREYSVVSDAEVQRIHTLNELGASTNQIAQITGRPVSTISYTLKNR